MPCCLWQWNDAFDMAGDGMVDTCCVANGRIKAQIVTKPSANAAVKMHLLA